MDYCNDLWENCNMTIENSSISNSTNSISNGSGTTGTQTVGMATLEQHQFAKYVLYFFVLPCIAIIGMLGNTMSLSVLQVTRRGLAFNVYLMALTSADILLLFLALGRCVVLIVARYPDVQYPALNKYGEYYLGLIFGSWLQRISATLISIIAVERFVAVAFPFKVKSLAIEKHPLKITVCAVVGNFLCQVPTMILLDVVQTQNPATNTTMYVIGLRYQTHAAGIARQIYLVFLTVINMFVPLLIVLISTIAILICLKMRSTSMRSRSGNIYEVKERDTMTLTLVSMAIIFTLCYIPGIIVFVISAANNSFYKKEIYLIAIIVDINIVIVCVNSASDFLMYVLTSKKFRILLVRKFLGCVNTQDSPFKSPTSSSFPVEERKTFTEGSRSLETSGVNVSIIEIQPCNSEM